MPGYEMYPTHLTEDEIALGLRLGLIPNDRRDYWGQPNLITVAAYEVGPWDLVIKVRDADGNIEYSHRQFSEYGAGDDPEWNAVLVPNPSAVAAIRNAQVRIDEEVSRRMGMNLDPSFPSMELACPSCNKTISLKRAFLPVSEQITCKACSQTLPAAALVQCES